MCAMSVAFDDQGEIVPRRGTTISCRPIATVRAGAARPAGRGP